MSSASDNLEVCLVMRQFFPVLAGASERFRRYAPGLDRRGIDMTAIARLADACLPTDERLPSGPRVLRVDQRHDVAESDRALFERALAHQGEAGRTLILQTNVAYNHTRPLIQKWRQRGAPAVWLGSMMEDAPAGLPMWRQMRERLRLRWLLGIFDGFTVGSTIMRDWLRGTGLPAAKIHVIGHGVDQSRFRPAESAAEKSELRARWNLPADAIVVLFVGTITARKGVHLLLEAWQKVLATSPNAFLVLAGAFDRPTVVHEEAKRDLVVFQEQVRTQLQRLGEEGRVRHLDEVREIELLMRAADVLILPSEREGVPNVVLEAMSSGLACAVTPFAGLPKEELGIEGTHYTLAPRTWEGIADTVGRLVNDEALRVHIGTEGLARAQKDFGLDRTLDAYAGLYRQLTSR